MSVIPGMNDRRRDATAGPERDVGTRDTTGPGAGHRAAADDFLVAEHLTKTFIRPGLFQSEGRKFTAVNDVSFSVRRGEIFGLVGESGCGKTTLGRALLYLDPPTGGRVVVDGERLDLLGARELRRKRRSMQIVFQDPNSALDPRLTVESSLNEALAASGVPRSDRRNRVAALLEMVGLDPAHAERRPSRFSGGQRQRIVIARALACEPSLIILDEPVSNLDVSIQAQIINLLIDLKDRFGLTYVFISHDLNLVSYLSDVIAVMERGKIVEIGRATELINSPAHEYTRQLFDASSVPGVL